MWQLLRPAAGQPQPADPRPNWQQARRIAAGQPRPDALLALMGDKSLLFSDTGKSFLMFAKHGRTWAALGDPVGPPDECAELVWRFIELADTHGGRVAFYQVPSASLPLYLDAGLRVMKIGEEARVPLPRFSLDGPDACRPALCAAARRARRARLRIDCRRPAFPRSSTSSKIFRRMARAARGRRREALFGRGFLPRLRFGADRGPVARTWASGRLRHGHDHRPEDEATVGLMRQRPDIVSRCAMEYLFVRLLQHFRSAGYRSFSLGMTPLSGFAADPLASRWHRLARFIWSHGRRLYNFQGLHAFKGKFDPVWESRYLAASGAFGPYLALADIAVLIGGGCGSRLAPRRARAKPRRHPVSAGLLCLALVLSSIVVLSGEGARHRRFRRSAHRPPRWRDARSRPAVFGCSRLGRRNPTKLPRLSRITARLSPASIFPAISGDSAARPMRECSDAVSAIELISREIQRERGNSSIGRRS